MEGLLFKVKSSLFVYYLSKTRLTITFRRYFWIANPKRVEKTCVLAQRRSNILAKRNKKSRKYGGYTKLRGI